MIDENKTNGADVAIALVDKVEVIYYDAIKPAAKRVGKIGDTVGGAIEMLLSPLSATIYCYDKIKNWLSEQIEEKLKNVPNSERIAPPAHVAVPAMQRLVYTEADELKRMFANLIANSMDSKTSNFAHPAFVEIISQLTPDEAQIINSFSKISLTSTLPTLKVRKFKSINSSYECIELIENCSDLYFNGNFTNPELFQTYISNLERLQIIEIDYTVQSLYEDKYKELEEKAKKMLIKENLENLKFIKGSTDLTHFGIGFVNCVTGKIKD
jgi:Abortive infection alpha